MENSSGTKGDQAPMLSASVPSSLVPIVPILRVAEEIEKDNPRVAYLCRFYAYQTARKIDPTYSGRGVGQFMTHMVDRLEKEEVETEHILSGSGTDPREIQMYFHRFYLENIAEDQNKKKPEEMAKIYQIVSTLSDAMKMIIHPSRVDEKTLIYAKEVDKKREQFEYYNCLPREPPKVVNRKIFKFKIKKLR